MIKGIISLFTSGAIFNPMVLLGILLGVLCDVGLSGEEIKELFTDYNLYLLALLVSGLYIFGFKKVYKEGGIDLDYPPMIFQIMWGVVKFTISALLTISFIEMLKF